VSTAKCRIAASVMFVALLSIASHARPALAQCGAPDEPGPSQTPTCTDDDRARAMSARTATFYHVPLHVFVSNPLVSMVSWMATRSQPAGISSERPAVRPKGVPGSTLRGGRTPKQVAW
jgi:hypothetical protein